MRVKRILCGLFVASIIVTLFAASALATEPSGDWTVDWETSYMNLKNEDHHANFTPVQVYYNYGSWFHDAWVSTEVSVPANGDGYALKLFEKIDEDEKYTCTVDITEVTDSLYLKISTEGLKRTFSYSHDGKTFTEVYAAENLYYLCSQAISKGKRFTGAMIGLYAYSGTESTIYPSFDSFEYSAK